MKLLNRYAGACLFDVEQSASDPLELESHMAGSYLMWALTLRLGLLQGQQMILTAECSLQFLSVKLKKKN